MVRTFITVFIHVASFASILGLYFTIFQIGTSRPEWHIIALTILGLVFALASIWEIVDYFKQRPKSFSLDKPTKIKNYMKRWLLRGGRSVIFSRDMSWADEEPIVKVLFEKAQRNELTICIQHEIPLTNKLKEKGANILTYSELGHTPRSRFTIIDFEKDGARVAVGGAVKNKHLIQEFRNGEHPFFSVAEDLIKILLAQQTRQNVPTS